MEKLTEAQLVAWTALDIAETRLDCEVLLDEVVDEARTLGFQFSRYQLEEALFDLESLGIVRHDFVIQGMVWTQVQH